MGRNAQAAQALEVGMGSAVERAMKQRGHLVSPVVPWRQADGMHHDQIGLGVRWSGVAMG